MSEAALPADATVAATAADLLFMRVCDADGTHPPPLGPTASRHGWLYDQPTDAATELEPVVQPSCADDWRYPIAFSPLEG